ncbi:uncharacterized protein [Apostichopus japonicus]|uniref:uncharacterized protein isoform X2 n=1 Tax=Stichopus japonicus TaxID=307972 RepID=UPI003AB76CEC
MDDDSAELCEPVSPDSSSTGSQHEEEMREAENSGGTEQKMGSDSDSNEEMETSEQQTNNQGGNMASAEDQEQFESFESRLDSDNDMESETRVSTVSDEQSGHNFDNQEIETEGDRGVSPMQSSVSEVSSEIEPDEATGTPGGQREMANWEEEGEKTLQADNIRVDSPKEEKLDYGESDEDDNDELHERDFDNDANIPEYKSGFLGSGMHESSGSNVQLDRRKSPLQEEMEDVDNVSQAEDEEFTPKLDSREGEIDDVSEQSGEESVEDRPPEPTVEFEPENQFEDDDVKKDEDLDDVSDQSDTDLEEESKSEREKTIPKERVQDDDVQEELDDVSDQSDEEGDEDDDIDGGVGDDETAKTSADAPGDLQEAVIPPEEQNLEEKDLDDVSDSEESESALDTESVAREESSITPVVPPMETTKVLDAVVDVHHHGDELDFEEELEDREEAGAVLDARERIEALRKQKGTDVKPDKQHVEEELESGEEGEMEDEEDQSKDGEAGEIEDDEAEEGEVKEPGDKKPAAKPVCRFFARGQCTWGPNCRFLHPGVNDLGNYSLIDFKEIEKNTAKLLNKDLNPPPPPVQETPPPEDFVVMEHYIPPPPIPEEPHRESAWERGIRQAKEAKKKVERRKEMGIREEPQFIVEETYDDFDMESAFHPDLHKSTAEQYGYGLEPDPEYNPHREMRERRREPRPPPRPEPPPPQKRPEPYHEPKFRENRISRKEQFGRESNSNRRPASVVERSAPRSNIPKHYPPPEKAAFQYRERREERPRPPETARKPADSWQDPWARTRSPKPKSKQQTKTRNRSGSLSSGSSVSRSRSRSYSSGSSRSSSASSYSSKSESRSPSPPVSRKTKPTKQLGLQPRERIGPGVRKPIGEGVKMGLKKPPGSVEKSQPVKKLGLQLPPQKSAKSFRRSISNSSISSASRSRSRSPSKSPARSRPRPAAVAKPHARRRRRSSSGSSHVSISSKSSADSDHMYANLASPVSSLSSPDRITKKKTKAKQREKFPSSKPSRTSDTRASRPKAMVMAPSMEAFREPPIQIKKASKPSHPKVTPEAKSKFTSAPAQMTSRNPVKHTTHKEIKLTLLNKPSSDGKKRYEVLGDGATKKVKPVAPVKPTTKVMVEKERRPAVKPLLQPAKKSTPSAMVAPVRTAAVKPSITSDRSERKRPPSPFKQREQPPAKMAHKAGSGGASKSRDPITAKKATISRREEILKQLKAVEDMIARKKAKMKD